MADDPELTQEELDRRAGDLAHRVMTMPYKRQEWPKGKKAKGDASRAGSAASPQAAKPHPSGR